MLSFCDRSVSVARKDVAPDRVRTKCWACKELKGPTVAGSLGKKCKEKRNVGVAALAERGKYIFMQCQQRHYCLRQHQSRLPTLLPRQFALIHVHM
jgi:hypothetical protein